MLGIARDPYPRCRKGGYSPAFLNPQKNPTLFLGAAGYGKTDRPKERRIDMAIVRMTGGKIKELREKCGLTQKQLGARIGCKAANISQMEQGRFAPSLGQLEKMASLFRKHPLELVASLPPEACEAADEITALSPDRRAAAVRLFQLTMEMAEVVSKWRGGSTK
jgi:transcriptional regulator with XRE-family HTH domain